MPDVLLDTGVWFGYFVKNDVFHYDANLLVKELISGKNKILMPEVERFELLNALTHELLNHEKVQKIRDDLRSLSPSLEIRYGDTDFWDDVLPANLPRMFLKPLDFIIASYALHWKVDGFYSFDQKLNDAVRRLNPKIVKLKIKKGQVTRIKAS